VIAATVLAALAATPGPTLANLHVSDGSLPFAGDRSSLTTVSPNGDGFRDRAIVGFDLAEPATVQLDVVQTDSVRADTPVVEVVWHTQARFPAGTGRLVWRPTAQTPPRTYVLRLTATDPAGRRVVYGVRGRLKGPVVRIQGIDALFTRQSYAPGDPASLTIACDARTLTFQVFAYSGGPFPTQRDELTSGTAMTPAVRFDWRAHRDAPATIRVVRAGNWTSGLYFVRIEADDGRVGYAPLVVRPRRLGEHRIAVVLSTYTWQAYNFEDANGDGWGDSWYVDGTRRSVDLARPFLDFGIPFRFHDWDTTFITWLARTGKQVDFLSDEDLDAASTTGDALARAYDLIVFPGHEEYTTSHIEQAIWRYRDDGGNLMFLSANNLFWHVRLDGTRMTKVALWRNNGRPEEGLVGVSYVGSNHGANQLAFVVTGAAAAPWAFAGTGLANGSSFGRYGIEIDARGPQSPRSIQVLAFVPDLLGPGRSAEMTYYETPAGAKVFAAGALNFAASVGDPPVSTLLDNVWKRLASP
jgi:hypothetical protein